MTLRIHALAGGGVCWADVAAVHRLKEPAPHGKANLLQELPLLCDESIGLQRTLHLGSIQPGSATAWMPEACMILQAKFRIDT
jgi:hypothetical protein